MQALVLVKADSSKLKTLQRVLKPLLVRKEKTGLVIKYNFDEGFRRSNEEIWEYLYNNKSEIELCCYCKPNARKKPELTVVKRGSLYHLRTHPNQTHLHLPDCPFYGELVETEKIWQGIKKFKVSVLEAPRERVIYHEKEELKIPLKSPDGKTKPRLTFVRLMRSLVDEAYGVAFNSLNKEIDRMDKENLILPSVGKVREILKSKLVEKLPRGFHGFLNLITTDQIQVEDDRVRFNLAQTRFSVSKRQISNWDIEERGYGKSLGKFLAIVISKEIKRKRKVQRIFLMPLLYLEENKPFFPIESRNEGKVIEQLLQKGEKMFKVITGSLSREYIKLKLPKCISYCLYHLSYYPDLIIFGNPIKIAEILGNIDKDYLKLKRKVFRELKELKKARNCNFEIITEEEK